MKKVILILSAAAAIAACTKNEVIPASSNENAEITFNVAPKTKADADKTQKFDTNNVFASWAYYLPSGKTWEANRLDSDAVQYIDNSTVSYQSTDNVWKNSDNTYYWPKVGSLTFFAYSLNKGDLELKHITSQSHVTCYDSAESYGVNGLIDLDENPNTDFLVAQISADQRGNTSIYGYNGVPMLFRHRLSRVAFAVKLAGNYTNSKFTLNSIKFNKLCYAIHYDQFHKYEDGTFAEYAKQGDNRSTQVYTQKPMEITSLDKFVGVPAENEERYIYTPQVFKDETSDDKIANIEVNYTLTATVGGKQVTENCTSVIDVKDYFESWEMGKRYTINLTFGLDEILWAPAVEDWEDVAGKGVTIEK